MKLKGWKKKNWTREYISKASFEDMEDFKKKYDCIASHLI